MKSKNKILVFVLGLGIIVIVNVMMLIPLGATISYILYGICFTAFFVGIYITMRNSSDPKMRRAILYGLGSMILLTIFALYMFFNTKAKHEALMNQTHVEGPK